MTLAVGRTLNTNSLTHSLNCNSSFDGSYGKSEDADEMPHHASSEPALFVQTHQSSEKDYLKIVACDPLIYAMDHPKLLYQTRRKNPLLQKGLNMEC